MTSKKKMPEIETITHPKSKTDRLRLNGGGFLFFFCRRLVFEVN
jgi:hypothetical protein